MAGLAPGGLGEPDPVIVDDGTSVAVHRLLVVTGGPAWAHGVLENAGAVGLLLLGGLLVATWWRGRGEARVLAGVLLTAAATVAVFLTSEALKQVVDEQRPCRVPGLPAVPDCPGVGDWSFPSNHATLAAALAIGIVLVRPRLGALAGPVAVGVMLLRVLAGVHYPHDVLAGLALGGTVTAAVVLALTPAAMWVVQAGFRGFGVGAPTAGKNR